MTHKKLRLEFLVILGLVALAFFIRVYRLQNIPVGLHLDEAANGVDALGILRGHFPIFFERNNGREPLFIYLQAISVALLGSTPFALRVTAAVVGALTVATTYWMTREAFARTSIPAQRLALWTALFLAFSYWHISLSRNGYRAITLPLMLTIAFALFWRAWRRVMDGSDMPWVTLILSGVFVGLTQYSYTSAGFVWVLLVTMALAAVPGARRYGTGLRRVGSAFGVIGVTAAIVFLPLAVYFLSHPENFLSHASETSVFSLAYNQGQPIKTLAVSILKTVGMLGVVSEPNLRHNPAGRPAFDLVFAAWLIGGFVLAIRRWRDFPYFFMAAWLVIFALPSMLTAEGVPHSLRAIGVLPAACTLAVLAMLVVAERVRPHGKLLATWLPLPFLLFSGITGVYSYFSAWNGGAYLDDAYNLRLVKAVPFFSQSVREPGLWLFPFWPIYSIPRDEPYSQNFIQEFLSGKPFPRAYIKDTATEAAEQLRSAAAGQSTVHLASWIESPMDPGGAFVLTDWKGLTNFLLVKHGAQPMASFTDGILAATTYKLLAEADYEIATSFAPADVSFGKKVRLTDVAYGHTAVASGEKAAALEEKWLPSGHPAWVALSWQAEQPVANDQLKVSLYLTDEKGHLAGQIDDSLAGDLYLFEETWPPGQIGSTYHILPTLPGIPPGQYKLYAAVYESETMKRLPAAGAGIPAASAALLGSIEVTRAITTPLIQPQIALTTDVFPTAAIGLKGYDPPTSSFNPGDTVPLTLFWQAKTASGEVYTTTVRLQTTEGDTISESVEPPGGAQFPTTLWRTGEIVRSWQDVVIPPTTPAGTYQLVASLSTAGRPLESLSLGQIEVGGQPRNFTAPSPQHPMQVTLGDSMTLLGYTLPGNNALAGETAFLTLHWRALAQMDQSYAVFVHVLGPDGRVVAQHDSPPGQGTAPTTGWVQGEYIDDEHPIDMPADLPPGQYQVEIGVYDPTTGVRLPVTDVAGQVQGDAILLFPPMQVIAP